MNNKAQLGIGQFVMFFIGIIVVMALIPTIADNVDTIRTTRNAGNLTYTMSSGVGIANAIEAEGQEYIGSALVTNSSTGTVIGSNITVTEGSNADGEKTVLVYLSGDGTCDGINYTSQPVNFSYEYGPDGYAESAGTRSMAALIVIMAALGVLGFAVYWVIGKSNWMR